MKHDRTSGYLDVAHACALFVPLVGDNDAALIDALMRPNAALEFILPDVREDVPMGLKIPLDRLEIT
jgi:hypothetical protein